MHPLVTKHHGERFGDFSDEMLWWLQLQTVIIVRIQIVIIVRLQVDILVILQIVKIVRLQIVIKLKNFQLL